MKFFLVSRKSSYRKALKDLALIIFLFSKATLASPTELYKLGLKDTSSFASYLDSLMEMGERKNARELVSNVLQERAHFVTPIEKTRLLDRIREFHRMFLFEESQSLYFQALAQRKKHEFKSALNLLKRAYEVEPDNLLILQEKADLARTLGEWGEAQASWQQLIAIDSETKSYLENLFYVSFRLKDFKTSLEALTRLSPPPIEISIVSILMWLGLKNNKEAERILKRVLPLKQTLTPQESTLLEYVSWKLNLEKKKQDSKKASDLALKLQPLTHDQHFDYLDIEEWVNELSLSKTDTDQQKLSP